MTRLDLPPGILNDVALRTWAAAHVMPYEPTQVNPASYDLRLANTARVPRWYWRVPLLRRLAFAYQWPRWSAARTFARLVLRPGAFVLCASLETTAIPDDLQPVLYLKSSAGRTGLEHLHAGLGDPGFVGQWTWELVNNAPWPLVLEPGTRLMQLSLARLVAPAERSYALTGRYQHQRGATPARNTPC